MAKKSACRPVVLCVLDGWGHRDDPTDNALAQADLPHWRRFWSAAPHTLIHTEGRHVGLPESVAMIAAGLGWKLDKITEVIKPIVYRKKVKSDYITVPPGRVAGVKQLGYGWKKGKKLISLNFEASIGAGETYDSASITGTPNMEVIVKRGTHGDIATVAMLTNAVAKILEVPPGLRTMKDLIISAVPNRA
jgi:hypothetical protein